MRDVAKAAGQPNVDSSDKQWDRLSGADRGVETLRKELEAILVQTENASLRQDLHALVKRVPGLFELLNQDARGDRRISLLDHSVDVLIQNIDYQAYTNVPADSFTPLAFAKFLLSHDSGKSLPEEKSDAGSYTLKVIEKHNAFLNFSERELAIVKALLLFDPIGRIMHFGVCPFDKETELKFAALRNEKNGDIPLVEREKIDPRYILKAKHSTGTLTLSDIEHYSTSARVTDDQPALQVALRKSAEEIREAAATTDLSVSSYFALLSVFYQLDVSAYSIDVGLKREVGLEFLLAINPDFSILTPEAKKLFVIDSAGSLPLQFSSAAAACHSLLKQELAIQ